VFDESIIQAQGFANSGDPADRTGFAVRVRTPYYRGVWLSLVEGADVTVDGETFSRDAIAWTIAGRTGTPDTFGADPAARWPYEEAATLTVPRPGGLEPGLHDLEVAIIIRMSYIPIEMQPSTFTARRRLTLVHA
jgi:hypothetical protein